MYISQITNKPDRFSCFQKIQLKWDPPVDALLRVVLKSLVPFMMKFQEIILCIKRERSSGGINVRKLLIS